jgi:hypothetical protein
MNSFYMVAASNASTDFYPQNTLVSFKNQLPQEIDVTGYKIALQSISLDNKYGNIPNGILGTRNHFLLFTGSTTPVINATPNAVCDITDYTMSPRTFANVVNRKLGGKGEMMVTVVNRKNLQVRLTNCVLLVHQEVNKCLNFSEDTLLYNGQVYTLLSSQRTTKTFLTKNDFPIRVGAAAPSIIKVQLEQMCCNISDVKLVQDLAVLKVNPKYPYYNVCKRKEYFNLNCNRLTTLCIRLVDENNWPLHLGSGQATFLKLQLKQFAMKSFVLRLSSLESRDVFSDNKNSSFRINLQQPIESSNWDVALSSIYLPSRINTGILLTAENFYIDVPSTTGEGFQRLILHDLNDFTVEGFVTHCTMKIAAAFPEANPPPITFEVEENKDIYVKFNVGLNMTLSSMLAYLLSQTPHPNDSFSPFVGEKDARRRWGKIDFQKLHPHIVLVYCNFVVPTVVGNTFGQVLQMIPYYNGDLGGDEIMQYEAQHLDFLPMQMNDKATLRFEMRNASGDIINFENDETEVLLTLVFREKM